MQLEEAAKILTQAKEKALAKIIGNDLLKISVEAGINKVINNLNFLAGAQTTAVSTEDFAPVTRMFGTDITKPEIITESTLHVPTTDAEVHLANVAALQSNIRERVADKILEDFNRPKDQLVLRHVAKRAGLEDYETATLNIEFVERIKKGLDAKEKAVINEAEINNSLK